MKGKVQKKSVFQGSKMPVFQLQKIVIVTNLILMAGILTTTLDVKFPNFVFANQENIQTENGLVTYSADKISDKKTNILFFNASWCPHCKATVKNIKENKADLDKDLNILSVDPDDAKNANLISKYRVNALPTFVKIDKDGNQIEKWSGQTTVSQLNNKK